MQTQSQHTKAATPRPATLSFLLSAASSNGCVAGTRQSVQHNKSPNLNRNRSRNRNAMFIYFMIHSIQQCVNKNAALSLFDTYMVYIVYGQQQWQFFRSDIWQLLSENCCKSEFQLGYLKYIYVGTSSWKNSNTDLICILMSSFINRRDDNKNRKWAWKIVCVWKKKLKKKIFGFLQNVIKIVAIFEYSAI